MLFIILKKEQINFRKCSAFASFAFLYLLFQPAMFVNWRRKNISFPRAQGIQATSLQRWALNLGLQIYSANWKMVYCTETIILAHYTNTFNVGNNLDKVVRVSGSNFTGVWGGAPSRRKQTVDA